MSELTSNPAPQQAKPQAPRIGIVYNPRSHRNQGRDLEIAERPNVFVVQPELREDIASALDELAAHDIDFLIINGGDGTVRDVLTCGSTVFEDKWPAIAVLPKGKTNALNVDLGAPSGWTLVDAIEAYSSGRRITRRPLSITRVDDPSIETSGVEGCGEAMLGFIMGGGAFTTGIQVGQDAHRLGAFNSLAVAATSVWGVVQALLGRDSNIWRRGTPMRFLLGKDKAELPHSKRGDPSRRSVFLASTLEKFPAGMKLFNPAHSGLKLAVLDKPRRRILTVLPMVLSGYIPAWVSEGGFRQVAVEEFELEIEDDYILDGEAYPAGHYRVAPGPELSFVIP